MKGGRGITPNFRALSEVREVPEALRARARLEERQAVVSLHEIVKLASHVLVEALEQEDVKLREASTRQAKYTAMH